MAISALLDLSPLCHGPDGESTKRAHEALRNSSLWDRLPFGGFLDGGSQLYEERHCPACSSTMQRPITPEAADSALANICQVAAVSAAAAQSFRRRSRQGRDATQPARGSSDLRSPRTSEGHHG